MRIGCVNKPAIAVERRDCGKTLFGQHRKPRRLRTRPLPTLAIARTRRNRDSWPLSGVHGPDSMKPMGLDDGIPATAN